LLILHSLAIKSHCEFGRKPMVLSAAVGAPFEGRSMSVLVVIPGLQSTDW
jgi:hypothetical protein